MQDPQLVQFFIAIAGAAALLLWSVRSEKRETQAAGWRGGLDRENFRNFDFEFFCRVYLKSPFPGSKSPPASLVTPEL